MATELGEGELVADTGAAILVELEDLGEVWIPESQIAQDSELYSGVPIGARGEVVVSDWIARQKGWA